MMDNGKMIVKQEKEFFYFQMEKNMKENLKMMNLMDMALIFTLTVQNMKAYKTKLVNSS